MQYRHRRQRLARRANRSAANPAVRPFFLAEAVDQCAAAHTPHGPLAEPLVLHRHCPHARNLVLAADMRSPWCAAGMEPDMTQK